MGASVNGTHLSYRSNEKLIATSQPGKSTEASLIYEDLIDKYNGSAALLNGLAAAKMHSGLFEEAEGHLQEALTKVDYLLFVSFYCC